MPTTFRNLENGAASTLRLAHTVGDGALKVQTGDGPKYGTTWPARVTAIHSASGAVVIFDVSGRSADTLTIAAAVEGTADTDLPVNSIVDMRPTKDTLDDIYDAIHTLEAGGSGVPAGSNGQLQVKAASGFGAIAGTVSGTNTIAVGVGCLGISAGSIVAGLNCTVGNSSISGGTGHLAVGSSCKADGEGGCVALGIACESVDGVGDGGCIAAFSTGWLLRSQSCASAVFGSNGLGDIRNKFVIGGGTFDDTNRSTVVGAGESQLSTLPMIGTSTNASPLALSTRGAGGPGNTVYMPIVRPGHTYCFTATIGARKTDGSKHAMFVRRWIIHNEAGVVSLEGSVQTVGTDMNTPGWAVAITADDTNDATQITVTGEATVHWTARLDGVEIG